MPRNRVVRPRYDKNGHLARGAYAQAPPGVAAAAPEAATAVAAGNSG
ncbi:hypothetical protein ACH4EC_38980 [Streptomyces anulatus]